MSKVLLNSAYDLNVLSNDETRKMCVRRQVFLTNAWRMECYKRDGENWKRLLWCFSKKGKPSSHLEFATKLAVIKSLEKVMGGTFADAYKEIVDEINNYGVVKTGKD